MINTVIVYDDDDENLGDFFSLCKHHVVSTSRQYKSEIKEINSSNIDVDNLGLSFSEVNQNNFLFFGFIHGSKDSMIMNETDHFISVTNNYYILSNAFVYTFSCHNGSDLADKLLENNVHIYWGYNEKASVCNNYINEFRNCALCGYDYFISGCSVEIAEKMMYETINDTIDKLANVSSFAASILMDNRDSIIVKGNKSMTMADFILK